MNGSFLLTADTRRLAATTSTRRLPATTTCRHWQRTAGDGTWRAGSGATWDLRSNALRPASFTSADAAGLPILPGLVRYDEIDAAAPPGTAAGRRPAPRPGPPSRGGSRRGSPGATSSSALSCWNATDRQRRPGSGQPARQAALATSHRVRTATGLIHLWHDGAESCPIHLIGDGHITHAESRIRASLAGPSWPSRQASRPGPPG